MKKWVLSAQEEKKGRGLVRPMLAAVCVFAMEMQALALPQGGQVAAGDVTIGAAAAGYQEITQTTDKGIINWQSFDIGQGEHVRFVQPSTTSNTLNRVTGSTNPSQILGRLSANGQITIINPNGVFFSKDSVVDVAGLTASTANIKDTDFLSNKMEFSQPGSSNAEIVNEGTISVEQAGIATLVAPSVRNDGIITAKLGRINLGGAEEFTVDFYGNDMLFLVVEDTALHTAVRNGGVINAEGGTITMSAKTAGELVDSFAGNTGTLTVASTTGKGGNINVEAKKVIVSGPITAKSTADKGGTITLNAGEVLLADGDINAQGTEGGSITLNAPRLQTSQAIDASGSFTTGGNIILRGESIVQPASTTLRADGQTAGGFIAVQANRGDKNGTLFSSAGTISATGQIGGTVQLSGDQVELRSVNVDVNGQTGGGTIHVGGTWQGGTLQDAVDQTTPLPTARTILVSPTSTFKANALNTGNGGEVVFWSEERTTFAGAITARGGALGGNGGQVEVSGKKKLGYTGTTDAAAPKGLAGTLLLDPKNIIIADTGWGGYVDLANPDPATGDGHGTSVVVLGNGNIVVASPKDDFVATNAGAGYLYNGTTGALMSSLRGSTASDSVGNGGVTALTNGNYVVRSAGWDKEGISNAGAVTWGNGTTGITGVVSAANSFVGTLANDRVGSSSVTDAGSGRYVVASTDYNGGRGNVRLFADPQVPSGTTFAANPSTDVTLSPLSLAQILAAGTNVTLQANNDITVSSAITVSGTTGGTLTLQAGRSILFNANVTTANGNLTAIANDSGAVSAQRSAGSGDITIASGVTLNVGTGTATLVGQNFFNNSGSATPITNSGSGRWLIYSTAPGSDTLDGMTAGFTQYSCSYPSCVVTGGPTQNGFLYSSAGASNILTITPSVVSVIYGDAAPANLTDGTGYGYTVSGFLGGDAGVATFGANTLVANTNYSAGSTVGGTYFINYSSGSLVLNCGGCSNSYTLSYANNASGVTVGQRTVTASLTGTVSKTYDGATAATLAAGNYSFSNLYAPDAGLLSISNTIATYDTKNVGTLKTVTMSAAPVLSGTKAANYTIAATPLSGNIGTITPASITAITGITASNKVYDAATAATLNTGAAGFTGRLGSDVLTVASSTGNFIDKNVGNAKTVNITGLTLGGADAGNYTLSSSTAAATANITPASIALTGLTVTKTYDASNTINGALFGSISTGVSGETITFTGSTTTSSPNVGSYSTATGSLVLANGTGSASNYNLISVSGTANITPKSITLTGAKQNDGNTTILPVHLYTNGVIATGIGLEALTLTGSGSVGDAFLLNTPQSLDVNGLSLQNGINGGLAANYVFAGSGHTAMVTSGSPITLNITPSPVTVIYGDSASTLLTNYSYTYDSNLILAGDTLVFSANTLMGSSTYAPGVNAGTTHAINYDSGGLMMTCSSCVGNYVLQYQSAANILTVIPRSLTPTLIGTVSKTYDATSTASLAINNISLSPTWNGEDIRVSSIGSAFFDTPSVGNNKLITLTTTPTLQGFGGANASNYVLDSIPAPASIGTIDQKPVTVAYDASRIAQTSMYTSTTPVITDLITSDAVSIDLTGAFALMDSLGTNASAGTYASAVGFGGSASLTGASSGNYFLIQLSGTLTVLAPPPPPTPPIPNDTITINLERQGIPGTSMFSPQWPVLEQISPATLADAAFRPIFDSYKADPFNALFVADLERIINRKIAKNTPKQTIIPTVFPGIYGKF
ncbi:MAG: beta strand repeat-containing protein [Holosporales bacterium]